MQPDEPVEASCGLAKMPTLTILQHALARVHAVGDVRGERRNVHAQPGGGAAPLEGDERRVARGARQRDACDGQQNAAKSVSLVGPWLRGHGLSVASEKPGPSSGGRRAAPSLPRQSDENVLSSHGATTTGHVFHHAATPALLESAATAPPENRSTRISCASACGAARSTAASVGTRPRSASCAPTPTSTPSAPPL